MRRYYAPVAAAGNQCCKARWFRKDVKCFITTGDTIGPPHEAARNRKAGGTGREKKPSDHAGPCTSSCGAKVRGTQVREERLRFRHIAGNEMMGLCQHIVADSHAVLSVMMCLSALRDAFCKKKIYFKGTVMNILQSDQQMMTVCEKDFWIWTPPPTTTAQNLI